MWEYIIGGATVFGVIVGLFSVYNGRATRKYIGVLIEREEKASRELLERHGKILEKLSEQHGTMIDQHNTMIKQQATIINSLKILAERRE